MPIIFSPVTEDPLGPPRHLFPRSAFLIYQQSEAPVADVAAVKVVKSLLGREKVQPVDAANFRRTGDYLIKILEQIRGSGFCIAVYSEGTRDKTLANIFLEVGMALLLGKPTIIVKTSGAPLPSDLVRSEYVEYTGDNQALRKNLRKSVRTTISETAEYLVTLAGIAKDAVHADLEIAFNRYLQAILMNGDISLLDDLEDVQVVLKERMKDQDGDPTLDRLLAEMQISNEILKRAMR